MADYDSPWKEALEVYFPAFLLLLFPRTHADIDWSRGLYERGWDAETVRQLFRIIDWLMELPLVLEAEFWREFEEYQEKQHMPYVTSVERLAMFDVLESTLRARFGEECAALLPAILELYDAEKYLALSKVIATVTSLDEVRQAVAEAAAPAPRRRRGSNGRRGRPRS
jgi:hypothetical protein